MEYKCKHQYIWILKKTNIRWKIQVTKEYTHYIWFHIYKVKKQNIICHKCGKAIKKSKKGIMWNLSSSYLSVRKGVTGKRWLIRMK